MSAYYLASKIVQEVGSTKATTGGASGNRAPFIGIYNYYNIGAYSGAMDGLEWAAGYLRLEEDATIYSDYKNGKVSGTKTKAKRVSIWYGAPMQANTTGCACTQITVAATPQAPPAMCPKVSAAPSTLTTAVPGATPTSPFTTAQHT